MGIGIGWGGEIHLIENKRLLRQVKAHPASQNASRPNHKRLMPKPNTLPALQKAYCPNQSAKQSRLISFQTGSLLDEISVEPRVLRQGRMEASRLGARTPRDGKKSDQAGFQTRCVYAEKGSGVLDWSKRASGRERLWAQQQIGDVINLVVATLTKRSPGKKGVPPHPRGLRPPEPPHLGGCAEVDLKKNIKT